MRRLSRCAVDPHHADGAAAIVLDQGLQEAAVVGVEARFVDLQPRQGAGRDDPVGTLA